MIRKPSENRIRLQFAKMKETDRRTGIPTDLPGQITEAIFENSMKIGFLIVSVLPEHIVEYHVKINKESADRIRMFWQCEERIIRMYHPAVLITSLPGEDGDELLSGMRYEKMPDFRWRKETDAWRARLMDKAFDDWGFLINQGLTENLPFGRYASREKGCGWIAAYNLLKWSGREVSMAEIAGGLSGKDFSGKLFGQNPFSLRRWLSGCGMNMTIQITCWNHLEETMNETQSGILVYAHKRGAHYTMYEKTASGRFLFYNNEYGTDHLILTVAEFRKRYAILPFALLMTEVTDS